MALFEVLGSILLAGTKIPIDGFKDTEYGCYEAMHIPNLVSGGAWQSIQVYRVSQWYQLEKEACLMTKPHVTIT